MSYNSEIKGLNCFTDIPHGDYNHETACIGTHFKYYGDIDIARTRWQCDSEGNMMYVVHYLQKESCDMACSKSEEIYYLFPYIVDIKKHDFPTKSPGQLKRTKFDQVTARKSSLSKASNINIRILNALRDFGYKQRQVDIKENKLQQGKQISMHWRKQFAVILVLPVEKYNWICDKEVFEVLPHEIESYAKCAIPTSYTENFDHFSENGRKVLHAEAKLMGNPVRDPPVLAVPYERSWLMRIINKHEVDQWKSGKAMTNKKYKLFLYSELEICDFCEDAIYQSIFLNLVKNGRVDDETKPVIGYCFNKYIQEDQLDISGEKSRVIFISPRSVEKRFAWVRNPDSLDSEMQEIRIDDNMIRV